MTCIVGLISQGDVWIGGDSAAATDWHVRHISQPKLFFLNGALQDGDINYPGGCKFLIGYTSSFRMGQLIEHCFTPPLYHKDEPEMPYFVQRFVPALQETLKDGGFSKIENNVVEGGEFLIGFNRKLFKVQTNFQVLQYLDGYDACGCGEEYALGALRVMQFIDANHSPERAIRIALATAGYFSPYVCEPYHVLHLKGEQL